MLGSAPQIRVGRVKEHSHLFILFSKPFKILGSKPKSKVSWVTGKTEFISLCLGS